MNRIIRTLLLQNVTKSASFSKSVTTNQCCRFLSVQKSPLHFPVFESRESVLEYLKASKDVRNTKLFTDRRIYHVDKKVDTEANYFVKMTERSNQKRSTILLGSVEEASKILEKLEAVNFNDTKNHTTDGHVLDKMELEMFPGKTIEIINVDNQYGRGIYIAERDLYTDRVNKVLVDSKYLAEVVLTIKDALI